MVGHSPLRRIVHPLEIKVETLSADNARIPARRSDPATTDLPRVVWAVGDGDGLEHDVTTLPRAVARARFAAHERRAHSGRGREGGPYRPVLV